MNTRAPCTAILMIILMTSFDTFSASPLPVQLGSSANFVLLAKTGISTTGSTAIVGDLGISPAAATFITGFDLIADPSNTFATSSLVTGKLFAADHASPTSTNLTTAVSDMEAAYTDAAGRPTPDFTELYAGDVTGKTLAPGLYKWGTGVMVSAGGVTISGGADDVWIFQIAQNLELANGANVTLTGGAQPSNIFWQVAGQVALGTTAVMKGILLCKTAIVMKTGTTLNGRAFSQTAITLDANMVTMPEPVFLIKNARPTQNNYPAIRIRDNQSFELTMPSNGSMTLRLFNVLGKEVVPAYKVEMSTGINKRVQFTSNGLVKGLYLAKLESNGKVMPVKVVLAK